MPRRSIKSRRLGSGERVQFFLNFRRAFRYVRKASVFVALISTASSLLNFFPSPCFDRSDKVAEGSLLFDPIL